MSVSDLNAHRRKTRPERAVAKATEERIRTMQLDMLLEMAVATAVATTELLDDLSDQRMEGESLSREDCSRLAGMAADLHLMCSVLAEPPECSPPSGAAA